MALRVVGTRRTRLAHGHHDRLTFDRVEAGAFDRGGRVPAERVPRFEAPVEMMRLMTSAPPQPRQDDKRGPRVRVCRFWCQGAVFRGGFAPPGALQVPRSSDKCACVSSSSQRARGLLVFSGWRLKWGSQTGAPRTLARSLRLVRAAGTSSQDRTQTPRAAAFRGGNDGARSAPGVQDEPLRTRR